MPQFDPFILVNFIYLDGNNRNMMYYTLTKIKCILIRVNFELLSREITIFKITTKLFLTSTYPYFLKKDQRKIGGVLMTFSFSCGWCGVERLKFINYNSLRFFQDYHFTKKVIQN